MLKENLDSRKHLVAKLYQSGNEHATLQDSDHTDADSFNVSSLEKHKQKKR
jgi:hypothetical protein